MIIWLKNLLNEKLRVVEAPSRMRRVKHPLTSKLVVSPRPIPRSTPSHLAPVPRREIVGKLSAMFGKLSGISGKLSGRKWRHSLVPRVPPRRPLQRPGHQGRHSSTLPALTNIVSQGILGHFRDAIFRTDMKTRKCAGIPGTLYCVLTWSAASVLQWRPILLMGDVLYCLRHFYIAREVFCIVYVTFI